LLAFSTTKAIDMVDNFGWCAQDIRGCMQFVYNKRFEGTNIDEAMDRVFSVDEVLKEANVSTRAILIQALNETGLPPPRAEKLIQKYNKAQNAVEYSVDVIQEFVTKLTIARFIGVAVGCLVSAFTIVMNVSKYLAAV
jgi:hypothetical protein